MKILQVIDKLDVGGAERIFVNITNLLYAENINVSVLTFSKKGILQKEINKKINIEKYQRLSKFSINDAKKLSIIINNYDIVHVHMRHVFRYVKLVAFLFKTKSKIILHDHSSDFDKIPFLLNSILRPKYYIGVSKELINWGKTKLKVKNEHCFLLQNTVVKINETNINTKKNGAVLVGNIKPDKNQLFAIQLIAKLNLELVIFGKIQDHNYYLTLVKEIENLKLKEKVTFVHDETNVQKELKKFKFALNTSKKESGPLVLIEFLAQSLPFISYKTGEISEVLENDLPDYFINNFNEDKWLEKINFLKKSKYDLESIYQAKFSPNIYIKKCLSIYQKIKNY
ncbi:glycosyltransferase [Polaribacter aestuariivivens]|uniref:glycosyltransferase n=1 Tax=Polaribacter aestuariivivens TaxID=2304626 RepID=UPI0014863E10|nr:glycosyltransferase [Polaribacter aestuariivivens]